VVLCKLLWLCKFLPRGRGHDAEHQHVTSVLREAKQHGVKKRQAKSAGKQKVSTAKVKEAKPDSTCVLVYSLGDEMYKWVRVGCLFKPFREHLKDEYTLTGHGKKSAREHLLSARPADEDRREMARSLRDASDVAMASSFTALINPCRSTLPVAGCLGRAGHATMWTLKATGNCRRIVSSTTE
jgi:hypothetical protein